ncbi:hypothetical protein YB2330_004159 [Saitoella coloradoensis]
MQSLADLTSSSRLTTGDIPPPLVGATTTVVGHHVYVFGGRLVTTRRMTSDIYVLDLRTSIWTRTIESSAPSHAPKPRYFHSANLWQEYLVIFGGMSTSRNTVDGLCVLNDVVLFHLRTHTWRIIEPGPDSGPHAPKARYAHLSAVSGGHLIVVGGQDLTNNYVEQINAFDLQTLTWTSSRPCEKHCGAYRSVAMCAQYVSNEQLYPDDADTEREKLGSLDSLASPTISIASSSNMRPLNSRGRSFSIGTSGQSEPSSAGMLTHSTPTDTFFTQISPRPIPPRLANPIYIYSNYNFADVQRELQVLPPILAKESPVEDISYKMGGSALPPGLRFPNGAVIGNWAVLGGTYLTNSSQTYSLWALDLNTYQWQRLDTGSVFASGSWNRGVLCYDLNAFVVFGNRERSLVEDYNHRQTNFDHVTLIDLESFGIYQPPQLEHSPLAQSVGLSMLSDTGMADMEVLTLDGKRIPCCQRVLVTRWPRFNEIFAEASTNNQLRLASLAQQALQQGGGRKGSGASLNSLPPMPLSPSFLASTNPRVLYLPHPYTVAHAFLQYLYTESLTAHPSQRIPQTLSALLVFSRVYGPVNLGSLAADQLHRQLGMGTAAMTYEAAALTGRRGLQIRSLKVMILAKKALMEQKRQGSESASSGGGGSRRGSEAVSVSAQTGGTEMAKGHSGIRADSTTMSRKQSLAPVAPMSMGMSPLGPVAREESPRRGTEDGSLVDATRRMNI